MGPDFFSEHGYTVISPAISPRDAHRYASYALMKRQHPGYYAEQGGAATLSRYGDVLGESVLRNLQPAIEAQTGLSLLPCFSDLRIYAVGARLDRQVGSPAPDLNVVLSLAQGDSNSWPFSLEEGGRETRVTLQPGDALVYRGSQLEHWRGPLEDDFCVELALHYVTAGGEFAHYRFDGRRGLGEPLNRKQQDQFIELRKEFDAALAAGEDRDCFCRSGNRYSACHGQTRQSLTA